MEYGIGIDLGGTKILTGIINREDGSVIATCKKKTKSNCGEKVNLEEKIQESIIEVLNESGIEKGKINSIGIGIAGQVDRENGILIASPNIDTYNMHIKQIIEEKIGIPTYIGNDVEIATIGEKRFGSGKECDDFICIFVGTGVGSCIVKNNKICYGATGTAGEIGHIIVDQGGRPCGCGSNGCLEAYASRTAIEKRITGALKKGRQSIVLEFIKRDGKITSSVIKKALLHKDDLVLQAIEEGSDYLASGIASVINLINPKLIILGGGLIEAVDEFYQRTIKKARMKALKVPSSSILFEKASLGDNAGIIGAAFLNEYRVSKVLKT